MNHTWQSAYEIKYLATRIKASASKSDKETPIRFTNQARVAYSLMLATFLLPDWTRFKLLLKIFLSSVWMCMVHVFHTAYGPSWPALLFVHFCTYLAFLTLMWQSKMGQVRLHSMCSFFKVFLGLLAGLWDLWCIRLHTAYGLNKFNVQTKCCRPVHACPHVCAFSAENVSYIRSYNTCQL